MGSRAEYCRDRLAAIMYDDAPSLILVAPEPALEIGRRAAAAAGFRISAEAGPKELSSRLVRSRMTDAILVVADSAGRCDTLYSCLPEPPGDGLPPVVIARLGASARPDADRFRRSEQIVVVDDSLNLLLALHATAAPRTIRLHDAKNHGGPRLQQLSEEVGRIATILASLSEDDPIEDVEREEGLRIDAALVRSVIRVRRLRDHYFRSAMFADPAWDMLLDLYAARLERQRVAVSSLCIAAAVPATTALRWIKTMTDQGLFVRVADPQDGRRVFIELSNDAAAGLEAYLKAAQRICPLIV